jgi:AbrB family looped-hinge helix DNA binding protein
METVATSKGQIVIPSALRRKYGIKDGTRIRIEDDERTRTIVLRPVTRQHIQRFRGILKQKRKRKPVTTQLLEDRAQDLKREEAKLAKHRPR